MRWFAFVASVHLICLNAHAGQAQYSLSDPLLKKLHLPFNVIPAHETGITSFIAGGRFTKSQLSLVKTSAVRKYGWILRSGGPRWHYVKHAPTYRAYIMFEDGYYHAVELHGQLKK